MPNFIRSLYADFEERNLYFHQHKKEFISLARELVTWGEQKMEELNQFLISYDFESESAEIHFFKETKPIMMSQLIFYKEVLRIESDKPHSRKLSQKYYAKLLTKIRTYPQSEHKLYQYYNSQSNEFDVIYFTRNSQKNMLEKEHFYFNIAPRVSTCYDCKIALIKANTQIAGFIENQIESLSRFASEKALSLPPKWHWTGSKTDLTELIYALHSKKTINNGNFDLLEMAHDLGKLLNIELNQSIYRNYTDIKNRKNSKTKFLDGLSLALQNKIDEEEC